ncbi:YbbR-like domain-containing protein [Ulvibacterium sp.]|uniref:CdaR family protein n=1 Tax=Ulvibacterium sp. TaxID=2665914 RepID=UPI0026103691|nr:YbbR-like domain-containing protein [Ulvibacterium sp.]
MKIFLLFLLCSGLAWFVSNLSEDYVHNAVFNLEYVNVPDSVLLDKASRNTVNVKLRAVGFQFLGFNFKNKSVKIDLSRVATTASKSYIPQEVYRGQIERQLSGSMTLLEMDRDTLFFDFLKLESKEVPVRPQITLNLEQNYLLDGNLEVRPEKITVKGPKEEIDTIQSVRSARLDLQDLTADFTRKAMIIRPQQLKNTTFSSESVSIKGKVARFSEKMIQVPIEVINLPEGTQIRTFPDSVSILCKAKIKELRDLENPDFRVIADYGTANEDNANTLVLKITRKPESIYSADLLETEVEFILKRE